MTRMPGKTKVDAKPVINPVLNKPSNNGYRNNSQNDFRHTKTPCTYWLKQLLLLIVTVFLVFLKLGYIYLIARYPKLNIFWLCAFDNLSETVLMFDIGWFICSLFLIAIITVIKEIYGIEVLNIGQWSFTAPIFVIIVSVLVIYVDVLPVYKAVFRWFS